MKDGELWLVRDQRVSLQVYNQLIRPVSPPVIGCEGPTGLCCGLKVSCTFTGWSEMHSGILIKRENPSGLSDWTRLHEQVKFDRGRFTRTDEKADFKKQTLKETQRIQFGFDEETSWCARGQVTSSSVLSHSTKERFYREPWEPGETDLAPEEEEEERHFRVYQVYSEAAAETGSWVSSLQDVCAARERPPVGPRQHQACNSSSSSSSSSSSPERFSVCVCVCVSGLIKLLITIRAALYQ